MNSKTRDIREVIREEMLMKDKIINILKEGPKTIPGIAREISYPSDEVLLWVMGLRKYGYVTESEEVTDDGYYQYRVAV